MNEWIIFNYYFCLFICFDWIFNEICIKYVYMNNNWINCVLDKYWLFLIVFECIQMNLCEINKILILFWNKKWNIVNYDYRCLNLLFSFFNYVNEFVIRIISYNWMTNN